MRTRTKGKYCFANVLGASKCASLFYQEWGEGDEVGLNTFLFVKKKIMCYTKI
jgi:hypothetical protein